MSQIEYYCIIILQCGVCTFCKEWKKARDLKLNALIYKHEIKNKTKQKGSHNLIFPRLLI